MKYESIQLALEAAKKYCTNNKISLSNIVSNIHGSYVINEGGETSIAEFEVE